jgi:chitinase
MRRLPIFKQTLLTIGMIPLLICGWASCTSLSGIGLNGSANSGIYQEAQGLGNDLPARRPLARSQSSPGNGHLLIGYWQDFTNDAPAVPLGKVSTQFDVINVAFATPADGSTATITFSVDPSVETKAQFKSDVAALHRQGKKVVLSIGGASTTVQLNSSTDVDGFVSSVSSIVKRYNFDGIDIDFEGASLALDSGDTNFEKPTTAVVVNLISALHRLSKKFGANFIISYAPETFFVQAAVTEYGGQRGCYLPVIYGTRNFLSYVQTQDYNSGTILGLDGKVYTGGTPDFHVALTEFLLQGFNVAGDSSRFFPPLQPTQVAFGVPASPQGASTSPPSFTTPPDVQNALNYLINGVPYPGHQYTLVNPLGYPAMRGLMTWSINWDAGNGAAMSAQIGEFLHGLPAPQARLLKSQRKLNSLR